MLSDLNKRREQVEGMRSTVQCSCNESQDSVMKYLVITSLRTNTSGYDVCIVAFRGISTSIARGAGK